MISKLLLTGITCSGRHGANPGERDRPQGFVVDLEVDVEIGDDALSSTADYRTLIRTARETVERESFELLESLAAAVAKSALALDGVASVRVTVRKPAAARSNDVGDVAAVVTVER